MSPLTLTVHDACIKVQRIRAISQRDPDLAAELHDGFGAALRYLDKLVSGQAEAPTPKAARQMALLDQAIASRLADTN